MHLPSEDKYYSTKGEMFDSIIVLLGGRAAEKIKLDDISTGASNDIERATKIARQMVTKFGMSDKIGPINLGSDHDEVFIGRDFVQSKNISEGLSAEIDAEVRKIIDDAYKKSITLLSENSDKLDNIANALMEKEKIDGVEFEDIFNAVKSEEDCEQSEIISQDN